MTTLPEIKAEIDWIAAGIDAPAELYLPTYGRSEERKFAASRRSSIWEKV